MSQLKCRVGKFGRIDHRVWHKEVCHAEVVCEIVDSVSYETVCRTLKKWDDESKNGILGDPPEADSEFVAHMEEVLEIYEKPYNPVVPVVCMDEQPVQLLKETRLPIPATAKHGKRVDYEYERAGTATIMFTEPLACWREVAVRKRKTKIDWAAEMVARSPHRILLHSEARQLVEHRRK